MTYVSDEQRSERAAVAPECRRIFAHESLLASQYAALEEPADSLTLDIDETPEQIAQRISDAFGLGL